jgi:hypothetical protein
VDKAAIRNTRPGRIARWTGVLSTFGLSCFLAVALIGLNKAIPIKDVADQEHELTAYSYGTLAVVFLIIVGGIAWCFYKAILAADINPKPQTDADVSDDEVADDSLE